MYKTLLLLEKIFAYLQGKGYGAQTVEREAKLALKLLGTDPKLVLDIGANKGHWTKAVLTHFPTTVVHAFEPQPVCARDLEELYRGNANVSIHRNAVSNTEASLSLYFDFEGSGLASLSKRELSHLGIDFSKSVKVETLVLDQFFLANHIGQIDILKIDVEGHELAVFDGMKAMLTGCTPPRVIQFEFGGCNIETRTFFRDFYQLFSNQYNIHRQTPIGLTRINRYRETDECFRTTNFFLKLKS